MYEGRGGGGGYCVLMIFRLPLCGCVCDFFLGCLACTQYRQEKKRKTESGEDLKKKDDGGLEKREGNCGKKRARL